MIQDGGETFDNRFELGKGVCGFFHQIDSQLGRGMCGGLPVRPILIRRTWLDGGFWVFWLFVLSCSGN